jgi:hypothetical protein
MLFFKSELVKKTRHRNVSKINLDDSDDAPHHHQKCTKILL